MTVSDTASDFFLNRNPLDEIPRIRETAAFIRRRMTGMADGETISAGMFTGTGLGDSAGGVRTDLVIPYEDLPHFPRSTVESHKGRLLIGRLGGVRVMVFQGRFHLYEGYHPLEVVYPVRLLREMGGRILVITNAAGGIDPAFSTGDIMIMADHINLTGENPLAGSNPDEWGIRFPDMAAVYDRRLRDHARAVAEEAGFSLQSGVYAGLKGPSLETPAEVRMLRRLGASAVGLSTVQEVIAAVHAGLRILGLSAITNINDPDDPQPAVLEDIIETAARIAPRLSILMEGVVRRWAAEAA